MFGLSPRSAMMVGMEEDEENFAPVWEEYRRRRRQWLTTFFGLFAAIMLLGTVPKKPHTLKVVSGIAAMSLVPIWLIGSAITIYRFSGFYCPRCDRPFFKTRWYHNSLARKCVHCGLPKWATKSPPGTRIPGLDWQ